MPEPLTDHDIIIIELPRIEANEILSQTLRASYGASHRGHPVRATALGRIAIKINDQIGAQS